MAVTETRNSPARSLRWSSSEKRRIVELTHGKGASISEIARSQGIHPTVLSRWRSLYRSGKLSDNPPRRRSSNAAPAAALLPVMISVRGSEDEGIGDAIVDSPARSHAQESTVIHVSLSSGTTLRI
jgi:transposase-like protein